MARASRSSSAARIRLSYVRCPPRHGYCHWICFVSYVPVYLGHVVLMILFDFGVAGGSLALGIKKARQLPGLDVWVSEYVRPSWL